MQKLAKQQLGDVCQKHQKQCFLVPVRRLFRNAFGGNVMKQIYIVGIYLTVQRKNKA